MYKILFFLNKNDDENAEKFFKTNFLDNLEDITGTTINVAQVESNLLLEQKYTLYCEISAASKEEIDKLMHTKAGKEFNKQLINFHKNITVIAVNYSSEK